jgi:hypothetical protein
MSNFSEMFLLLCTDTYPKKKQRNKIEKRRRQVEKKKCEYHCTGA